MQYKFVDQILDSCKTNAVMTLKKMMMPRFYWQLLKKYSILLKKRCLQLKLQEVEKKKLLMLKSYKFLNKIIKTKLLRIEQNLKFLKIQKRFKVNKKQKIVKKGRWDLKQVLKQPNPKSNIKINV